MKTCYDYITDEQIEKATAFEGYQMYDRTKWPLRYRYPFFTDDYTNAHAYHIQRLASVLKERGWIGNQPLFRVEDSQYLDGQNRVRAIKYLRDSFGILVEIPRN